jgi:hypothetical protein
MFLGLYTTIKLFFTEASTEKIVRYLEVTRGRSGADGTGQLFALLFLITFIVFFWVSLKSVNKWKRFIVIQLATLSLVLPIFLMELFNDGPMSISYFFYYLPLILILFVYNLVLFTEKHT